MEYINPLIKFNHEEVEALLNLLAEIEANNPLNEAEQSAKGKLKQIYARQILSYERKQTRE